MKSKVLILKADESSVYSSILKIFDFYPHVLENNVGSPIPFEDGVKAITLIEDIQKSIIDGREVNIDNL